MPTSTAKRVILYRFDRQPVEGIINPAVYLLCDSVELITVGGILQKTLYTELKALCFASEVGSNDLFREHKIFERRPKIAGLWTRFIFRDGDRLDGILSHNLLDWPEAGYFMTPPRAGAMRQRVFIPRAALIGTELRGVVGRSAAASKPGKTSKGSVELGQRVAEDDQLKMFDT